jgi:hypothetical protein
MENMFSLIISVPSMKLKTMQDLASHITCTPIKNNTKDHMELTASLRILSGGMSCMVVNSVNEPCLFKA